MVNGVFDDLLSVCPTVCCWFVWIWSWKLLEVIELTGTDFLVRC